jgi:hypothetical protein
MVATDRLNRERRIPGRVRCAVSAIRELMINAPSKTQGRASRVLPKHERPALVE